MRVDIDHYFTTMSPWAYIGFATLLDMAQRTGVAIRHRPVKLLELYSATDTKPLLDRHQTRKDLRMVELQRWREKRGLGFNLSPPHWPFDPEAADRFVIALSEEGEDAAAFIAALFDANWLGERDLGDERVIAEIASGQGLDGERLLAKSKSGAMGGIYDANTKDALAAGVFGSPSYLLNGELFWGQDRLGLLEDAITSGRAPYTPSGDG